MTGNRGNGSENGARSGAQTLLLLAAPLNALILRALAERPQRQRELQSATGMPAQTTLRAQLKRLERLGAIEKQRRDRFPGTLEYELTAAGGELLEVATVLERWLARAPGGSLRLGDSDARAAVKALVEAWSSTMLRVFAAGPLSLTEMDRVVSALSYPAIERRLAALRIAGLIEARTGSARGTPYGLTPWTREGIGPIAAAARWELRRLAPDHPPIGYADAEALFLLTAPLLSLPQSAFGSCRLAIELLGRDGPRLAGAVVTVEEGRIRSCTSRLQGEPEAWALGPASGWLDALVLGDAARIETGGDGPFARTMLASLHGALFGNGKEARP